MAGVTGGEPELLTSPPAAWSQDVARLTGRSTIMSHLFSKRLLQR